MNNNHSRNKNQSKCPFMGGETKASAGHSPINKFLLRTHYLGIREATIIGRSYIK